MSNDYSNKIQVFVSSKKEYKDLLNLLSDLEVAGIKTKRVHYLVYKLRSIKRIFVNCWNKNQNNSK